LTITGTIPCDGGDDRETGFMERATVEDLPVQRNAPESPAAE
jgi:hypothetical protein